MDICTAIFSVFAVVLLLALVVIVRSVFVLRRRGNNVALDKRKPVKVMVVAGSGSSCRSINRHVCGVIIENPCCLCRD